MMVAAAVVGVAVAGSGGDSGVRGSDGGGAELAVPAVPVVVLAAVLAAGPLAAVTLSSGLAARIAIVPAAVLAAVVLVTGPLAAAALFFGFVLVLLLLGSLGSRRRNCGLGEKNWYDLSHRISKIMISKTIKWILNLSSTYWIGEWGSRMIVSWGWERRRGRLSSCQALSRG